MKIYLLEKWYFDLLTPQQDFFFFYYARLRFCFYHTEQIYLTLKSGQEKSGFEKSWPTKSIRSNPGSAQQLLKFEHGSIEFNEAKISIRVRINTITIHLDFRFDNRNFHGHSLSIEKDSGHRINWLPQAIRAEVSGEVQTPVRNLTIQQSMGYMDYMKSTIVPVQNPVRQLFWGRIHFNGGELAFTCAFGPQPRQRWGKLYMKFMEEYIELDRIDLLPGDWTFSENLSLNYPKFYKIIGHSAHVHLEIHITNMYPLSESFFISREFTSSALLYKLYQIFALHPRGIKFLSRFHILLNHPGEKDEVASDLGITEFVVFSTTLAHQPEMNRILDTPLQPDRTRNFC